MGVQKEALALSKPIGIQPRAIVLGITSAEGEFRMELLLPIQAKAITGIGAQHLVIFKMKNINHTQLRDSDIGCLAKRVHACPERVIGGNRGSFTNLLGDEKLVVVRFSQPMKSFVDVGPTEVSQEAIGDRDLVKERFLGRSKLSRCPMMYPS